MQAVREETIMHILEIVQTLLILLLELIKELVQI